MACPRRSTFTIQAALQGAAYLQLPQHSPFYRLSGDEHTRWKTQCGIASSRMCLPRSNYVPRLCAAASSGMPRVLSTSSSLCQSPILYSPLLTKAKASLQGASAQPVQEVYVSTLSELAFLQVRPDRVVESRLAKTCEDPQSHDLQKFFPTTLVSSNEHFDLFTVPESRGNISNTGNEPGTSWWSCRT